MKKTTILTALTVAACTVLGQPVLAQAYPAKPIRIVVPFVPGGPVDVMARVLGEQFAKSMGQTVVVDNRPGAGGNIGSAQVAESTPDGYTLMLATGSILTINESIYPKLGFDPAKDFAPVSLVGDMPLIVAVNAGLPMKTLNDLVDFGKTDKTGIFLSSPGNGTTPHLAAELFKREAGTKVQHVPYKGGAESATAIVAGHVTGGIESPPAVLPHIQSDRLRALAIAGPRRMESLPNVPTTTELGYPGVQIISWFGLVAPRNTPDAIVQKLNDETLKALKDPGLQARFERLAIRPAGSTPAEFTQLAADDRLKWRKIVTDAKIKLE